MCSDILKFTTLSFLTSRIVHQFKTGRLAKMHIAPIDCVQVTSLHSKKPLVTVVEDNEDFEDVFDQAHIISVILLNREQS